MLGIRVSCDKRDNKYPTGVYPPWLIQSCTAIHRLHFAENHRRRHKLESVLTDFRRRWELRYWIPVLKFFTLWLLVSCLTNSCSLIFSSPQNLIGLSRYLQWHTLIYGVDIEKLTSFIFFSLFKWLCGLLMSVVLMLFNVFRTWNFGVWCFSVCPHDLMLSMPNCLRVRKQRPSWFFTRDNYRKFSFL